ncbi:hypothetical protein [Paenibacillus thalictri]|uniref:Uncharacterized protein n=1 Tax=Paenibacillus thalictri TaxID=2527873 RepID=A0A4Q9DVD7_9BACL|nr:hypothetical protein [Paenibacillus thalictri]TBL79930.1 hypothetical protein EYB31_10090 [Paenibacillus thalictri]
MESQTQTDLSQTKNFNETGVSKSISSSRPLGINEVWIKLAFWMKITAFLYLAFGVFQVFIGFVQFGFGTVVGIVQIIIFAVLIRLAKQINEMPDRPDDASLLQMNLKLLQYFRMQTLQIAGLFLSVVILVVTVVKFLSNWQWLIELIKWGKKLGGLLYYIEMGIDYIKNWFL